MPNLFFGKKENDEIILDKQETAHLKIMRKKENEQLDAFINDGKIYKCIIKKFSSKNTILKINEIREQKLNFKPNINLYFGISKVDRMNLLIEKAVEMRINTINIYKGEKSTINYKNEDKIKKTAIQAAKQSYLSKIPDINIINFKEIVLNDNTIAFDFSENYSMEENLKNDIQEINLLFGPDMGFSDNEKKILNKSNIPIINLGKTIFRFETSIFYVLSIINYKYKRLL
ncbi:16S rRNA (uracil(1498)-N(3))-methyltransferase [Oceanotoga teriensis]|uniref:16S rRNA (uracil(1498)-N(3))-methyltransferase n=1 Tax=Oceanotoga teriensis TaxID=515440 RepID=UPI0027126B8C|nr:RsmE family RNA methyltransferase [Oceanotoga teriensis]MDO7975433.1 16S rRNA (uracil(1498)-N(3))-methyltransferase [Oceanotoga teriensis]